MLRRSRSIAPHTAIALTFKNEAARSRRIGGDHGVDVFYSTCVFVLCVCVLSRVVRGEKREKKVLDRWSLLGLELTNPHEGFSTKKFAVTTLWFLMNFETKSAKHNAHLQK